MRQQGKYSASEPRMSIAPRPLSAWEGRSTIHDSEVKLDHAESGKTKCDAYTSRECRGKFRKDTATVLACGRGGTPLPPAGHSPSAPPPGCLFGYSVTSKLLCCGVSTLHKRHSDGLACRYGMASLWPFAVLWSQGPFHRFAGVPADAWSESGNAMFRDFSTAFPEIGTTGKQSPGSRLRLRQPEASWPRAGKAH